LGRADYAQSGALIRWAVFVGFEAVAAEEVSRMIERLRREYRNALPSEKRLTANSILYDEAHALYDRLARGSDEEEQLWAAIFVYELIISAHKVSYLKWADEERHGSVVAEILGDFETRRIELNSTGAPLLWSDMADVTWDNGERCVLSDQPFPLDGAIASGAEEIQAKQFESIWAAARQVRGAGRPNPMLAPSVLATFEELRIARGE
jgi:hypothetical protein